MSRGKTSARTFQGPSCGVCMPTHMCLGKMLCGMLCFHPNFLGDSHLVSTNYNYIWSMRLPCFIKCCKHLTRYLYTLIPHFIWEPTGHDSFHPNKVTFWTCRLDPFFGPWRPFFFGVEIFFSHLPFAIACQDWYLLPAFACFRFQESDDVGWCPGSLKRNIVLHERLAVGVCEIWQAIPGCFFLSMASRCWRWTFCSAFKCSESPCT